MNDSKLNPNQATDDTRQAGRTAASGVQEIASDAEQLATDATATTRPFAKDAVNAAGKKIHDLRGQLEEASGYVVKAIHDEPVKAVLIAAAVSLFLTAVLLSAPRSNARRY